MPTTRAVLTYAHVRHALQLAEDGTTSLAEWADEREPGLRIRVRGRAATWLLQFGRHTVTLGPAKRWTPLQAREMASHVRGMLRSELDPRPWIAARLAGATPDEAAGVLLHRRAKQRQEWSLGTVLQTYLDEHIRQGRVVRGVRRPPSTATARDVEAVLRSEPFAAIANLFTRQFDEAAFEQFRNATAAAHGGSASRKAVAYVSAALSWARFHHAAASGLVGAPRWWRDVRSIHVETVRNRMPSVADLGLTLALAREAQHLSPSGGTGPSETAVLALWFVLLTAQRLSVVGIEHRFVVEDDRAGDGSGIVYIPAELMKSRREHVVPLPPAAMALVRPAIAAAKAAQSRWLFPAPRKRRADEDLPIHKSTLYHLLLRLRGGHATGKRRLAPDLLSAAGVSVPDWSPHDVRRTFATVIEDRTTRGDAVSAVLDHAQDGGRSMVPDAAAITRIAYSRAQRLPLKRLALEPWVAMIFEAVAAAESRAKEVVAEARAGRTTTLARAV
ncbi:MAG: tyrosine-type recombinase/integrase [Blastochloris sp.]|nr:tyrosine-type recombinase/integrase [Blastochloris sp.]